MFEFIRTACTAIKESFNRACAATKKACKSAYTKIRNFFFGTPVEMVIEPINARNYGALSNFIDPLAVQRPHKPTESQQVLPVITNKNGIPAPFSSQMGRFKRNAQPQGSIIVTKENAEKPVLPLSPRVPGPFSPEAMRFSRSTITRAKTVSEPNKPFIPIVSSKDFLDNATLNKIREKSPDGFAPNSLEPAPLQLSEADAPIKTVASNDSLIAAASNADESAVLGPLKATVELCDNFGSILEQAIKDGKPQEAFNSAVESVSGLFWGTFRPSATTNNKPTHASDGWATERATSKPKLNLNQNH